MTTETINENGQRMLHLVTCYEIMKMLFEFQEDGKGTVFCGIEGHVQLFEVRIYTPVWISNQDATFSGYVYIDDNHRGEIERLRKEVEDFISLH